MLITKVHIDRFGILADQDIPALSQGLSVFLGHNEAGKSTCLQFFKAMLFGYKRKNKNIDPLSSKSSKKNLQAGGSLFLQTKLLGDLVLTRRPEQHEQEILRKAAGGSLSVHDLHALLQGLTADVFDNVFAFNLETLMQVKSLDDDAVRHALFAASFGLGSKSPSAILKSLDAQMTDLLSKQNRANSNASINATLQRLSEIQEILHAQGSDMEQFELIQSSTKDLDTLCQELAKHKETLLQQRKLMQKSLHHWQDWENLRHIQAKLTDKDKSLLDSYKLMPSSLERLERLLEQRDERVLSLEQCKSTLANIRSEGSDGVQTKALALREPWQSLWDEKNLIQNKAQEIGRLEHEIKSLKEQQDLDLRLLGGDWTLPKALSSNVSLLTKEDIRKHQVELQNSYTTLKQADQECTNLGQDHALALKTCQDSTPEETASLPIPLPQQDELEALITSLARTKVLIAEFPQLAQNAHRTEQQAQQSTQDINATWTMDYLISIDTSQSFQEKITLLASKNLEAQAERNKKAEATAASLGVLENHQSSIQELQERLAKHQDCPRLEELEQRSVVLKNLELLTHDLHKSVQRQNEATETLEGLKSTINVSRGTLNKGKFALASVALLASLASIFVGLQVAEQGLWYAGVAGTLLAFLSFAWLLTKKTMGDRQQQAQRATLLPFEAMLASANGECASLSGQIQDILQGTAFLAVENMENVQNPDHIRQLQAQLESHKDTVKIYNADLKALQSVQEELAKAEQAYQTLKAQLQLADQEFNHIEQIWQENMLALPLSEQTLPNSIQGFFERVHTAKAKASLWEQSHEACEKAKSQIAQTFDMASGMAFFAQNLATWQQGLRISLPEPQTTTSGQDAKGEVAALVCALLAQDGGLARCEQGLSIIAKSLTHIKELQAQEQKNKENLARLLERTTQLKQIEEKLAKAADARNNLFSNQNKAMESWQNWLLNHHLSCNLSPETALDAIGIITNIRGQQAEIDKKEHELTTLQHEIQTFLAHVKELQEKGSYPSLGQDFENIRTFHNSIPKAISLLEKLKGEIEQGDLALARQEERNKQEKSLLVTVEQEQANLTLKDQELASLLHTAQAQNAEDFRLNFAFWELRQSEKQILALLQNAALDLGLQAEEFLANLAGQSQEEINLAQEELRKALQSIEQELEKATGEKGALKERQNTLVQSLGTADLRQEQAFLTEQLAMQSKEWQTLALAKHIFMSAKEKFEKESQQGVIGKASEIFASITSGEYQGISLDIENQKFQAFHKNGEAKDPEKALSQGTKEQLYLSLRLAYIANHAQKAEAIPIIMDDILVNFDPVRLEQTAKVLVNFSQHNQILFFTCHPNTAKVLLEAETNLAYPPKLFHIEKGNILSV